MDFHHVAVTLNHHISGVGLNTALSLHAALFTPEGHEGFVMKALNTPDVLQEVVAGRKILAIKNLRAATGAGLKETKDAIEDRRVWGTFAPTDPRPF